MTGFRKYQSVEETQVVEPEEAAKIGAATHKVGKTSVRDMTPAEKRALPRGITLSGDRWADVDAVR